MPRSAPVLHPLCTRSAPSGAPSAQAPQTPNALCVCTGLRQQRACLRRRRAGEAHHRPRVAQHAGITRPARRGRGIRRGGAAARLAGCRGTAWRRRGRGACSGAGGLGTARHRHVGSMTCGDFYLLTLLYRQNAGIFQSPRFHPDRPSTREMLTISRPPPRRCSAACLPGSATRRLCIFFAYRWLPRDHAPCLCPVFFPVREFLTPSLCTLLARNGVPFAGRALGSAFGAAGWVMEPSMVDELMRAAWGRRYTQHGSRILRTTWNARHKCWQRWATRIAEKAQ